MAEKTVNCANFFLDRVVLGEKSKGKASCCLNAHDDEKEEEVTDEKTQLGKTYRKAAVSFTSSDEKKG